MSLLEVISKFLKLYSEIQDNSVLWQVRGGEPPKYLTNAWISLKTDLRWKKWRADSSEVDNRPESGAGNSSAEHPVAWRQIDFHPHFYFVARRQDTR